MKKIEFYADKRRLLLHVILLVSLTSMVFISPFGNDFRFTLGVILLSTALLYFPQLPVFRTIVFSGVAIVIVRVSLYYLIGTEDITTVATRHLPALAYYLTFGILFKLFDIRKFTNNLPAIILLLSITDMLSNCVELALRLSTLGPYGADLILAGVILVAVIRAMLSVYGYMLITKYRSFVLTQHHISRYAELMMMIAKLRTELFYLKKSSQDIEVVMERTYWLYQQLNGKQPAHEEQASYAARALEIARDIHEVKKDYSRVVAGIEKILNPADLDQPMTIADIFHIIEQNLLRYLDSSKKNITLSFQHSDDFTTPRHYTIVSLLDNLLMNAIDACGQVGHITVSQFHDNGYIRFTVEDDGCGIPPDEEALIFEPGFSTKFSPLTGKMSTGLGLCHVKLLTESLAGTVTVSSLPDRGTVFTVTIPQENIR